MRIIAGSYRGKKLITPSDAKVRPTAERAREALFSIIYSRFGGVQNFKVLDVFAGTGAFGFEALSRGAECVAFIDIDPVLVRKNAALFPQEQAKISVIKADALKLPVARKKYNFLFMDAPYSKNLSLPAILQILTKGWLEDGAVCLIETRHDEAFEIPAVLTLLEERVYGIAKIGFYIYKKEKI